MMTKEMSEQVMNQQIIPRQTIANQLPVSLAKKKQPVTKQSTPKPIIPIKATSEQSAQEKSTSAQAASKPAGPIRVMVVDDQPVVRSGLAAFLESYTDLQMVAEASDGARAVRLCSRFQPDVILMDLSMPVMDGAEATRQIRKHFPHIQVLALTSFKDDDLVQRVLQAGAIGYLIKNLSADELANAIRAAYAKRPTLSPEATEALIRKAIHVSDPAVGSNLTEREHDVLALLVEGLNNNEIAKQMMVSRSTVKFHVSNLLAKLHASNRMEAISIALRHHILEGEAV